MLVAMRKITPFLYSTVANPSNFMILASVSYIPSNPSATGDATRVVINDATGATIANNVACFEV